MAVHKFKACRYCADQVDVEWLDRHENKCKTRTPEHRVALKRARTQARAAYRQHHLAVAAVPVRRKRGPYKKGPLPTLFNGNGRRLSATISIDFKSFREVLLQLAPMLSIDKVEVL